MHYTIFTCIYIYQHCNYLHSCNLKQIFLPQISYALHNYFYNYLCMTRPLLGYAHNTLFVNMYCMFAYLHLHLVTYAYRNQQPNYFIAPDIPLTNFHIRTPFFYLKIFLNLNLFLFIKLCLFVLLTFFAFSLDIFGTLCLHCTILP